MVGERNYYISQKRKLTRVLDKTVSRIRPVMDEKYGVIEAEQINQEILLEFEKIIPEIPYIGGKKNRLTLFLVQSAWGLAFYRALQKRGGSLEEAGELLQQAAEAMFNAVPRFLRHLYGRFLIHQWRHSKMTKNALETQKREYPENWVQKFIVSDGETFDLGYDYTECGIVKFLEAQDASELTPYLCHTDFAALESMGLNLERTETISSGCARCNFRISKN
jgi:hypothetical protein